LGGAGLSAPLADGREIIVVQVAGLPGPPGQISAEKGDMLARAAGDLQRSTLRRQQLL
jgi:hypothetical protein